MAATVGSISIDLSTNAAKFASGFKSAATTVESQSARMAKSVAALEKGVNSIGGTLKTFVVGLAAGAGLAAIASLSGAFDKLKETISEYDEIATNAKQTGLKSDTYQALAFAAKQANISQESYNTALTIFAKNAGLAERGTGALFEGLKKLNPELLRNILSTTDQETRLKLVADALKNTTDATQKAALSAVVFGKSGVEMARFLDQGRASIDAMKKSAKDMGIIVPDELLQKAGELDDKLDLLSQITHVQLGQALINLAPLLIRAEEGFANVAKEISNTSSALDNFVNNPSWATLEKLIVAIGGEPFKKDSLLGHLANGTMDFGTSTEDIAAIAKGVDFLNQKIAELQAQAAQGVDVHIELQDAQQSLADLETRLVHLQGVGVAAADNIRTSLAEAFRASENASMAALKQMVQQSGNGVNVTRYGSPASSVTPGSTYQTDVNSSGVSVRKYGGTSYSPTGTTSTQTDVNGSGVSVTKYNADTADNTKDTAGYTKDTVDRVDQLDQNTGGYFHSLSRDMASYSANQVSAINGLGSSISSQVDALGAITQQMVAEGLNSGNISKPSNMFGDQWDPEYGSHVGDVWTAKRASFHLAPDNGSSDVHATVSQPGSNYTLNYTAAPGDSVETTKQKARAAFEEMIRAAESA